MLRRQATLVVNVILDRMSRLSQPLAQRRLIMLSITAFAVLAMILAGAGVNGVFSYWVSQSGQEMAIRLAPGFAIRPAVSWSRSNSFWGISPCKRRSGTWAANRVSATQ